MTLFLTSYNPNYILIVYKHDIAPTLRFINYFYTLPSWFVWPINCSLKHDVDSIKIRAEINSSHQGYIER